MKSLQAFKNNPLAEQTKLEEGIVDTATVKILPSGRKSRAHRLKIGDIGRVRDASDEQPDAEEDENNLKENLTNEEPPFVIVLKRKAIRYYPNNLKVALYYNDRLKKYFSVPYTDIGNTKSVVQAEEYSESLFDKLGSILESKTAQKVFLDNGDIVYVDYESAYALTKVYESLNETNKEKLVEMIHESSLSFNKAVAFSLSKIR